MTRARRSLDPARMRALTQGPGQDPRLWVVYGIVKELGFDTVHGPFADVQFIPSGETETCLIGVPYAGGGFGQWGGLRVNDQVLVTIPYGDPNHGPVVTARIWSASDPPFAEMKADQQEDGSDVPSDNFTLRIRDGQKLTLVTSGTGEVHIKAEGAAKVVIESAGDKVYIGGAEGTEPIALGTRIQNYLAALADSLTGWLPGHTHSGGTLGGGLTGPVSPASTATIPHIPSVTSTKAEVKE